LQNSIGKSPHTDLDKGESLEDTESKSDNDDPQKPWKVLTKLNKHEKQKLQRAADKRIARGLQQRQITYLGSMRASKRQKQEGRKKGRYRNGRRRKGRGC
jgi:hypothetical protein